MFKRFKQWLCKDHSCRWVKTKTINIVEPDNTDGLPIGYTTELQCSICGDLRIHNVRH